MTDLTVPGTVHGNTGWQLSPPSIPPTSMQALEADNDPEWIGYKTPLSPTSLRNAHPYIKFFLPRTRRDRYCVDQWITPNWQEASTRDGAVWTNETLHFAVDNSLPLLQAFIDPNSTGSVWFDVVIKAGLEQRKARAEGRSDDFFGEGLKEKADFMGYIVSTMAITTEVKRLLPEEGTKWLLLRIISRSLLDDRMDYDIVVIDRHGALIATSQHAMMVIPIEGKTAKKAVL